MSDGGVLCWVIALSCEAAPVRERYKLQRVQGGPFPVYRSTCGGHWLVESGIGRSNAAAAVMHLHHVSQAPRHAAWLNLGIAGHRDLPLGEARLINQVVEQSTGRTFYPVQLFTPPFLRASLTTVDQVAEGMTDDGCYDMEGSAVLDLASRLSSPELVALVKLVSDHGVQPGQYPKRSQVSAWIEAQMDDVDRMVEGLKALSADEARRTGEPRGFTALIERAHFTVSQRHQARDLLRRCKALGVGADLTSIIGDSRDAKWILKRLADHLDGLEIDWAQG